MDASKVGYAPRVNYEKVPNGRFDNADEILKRKRERESKQEQTRRKVSK